MQFKVIHTGRRVLSGLLNTVKNDLSLLLEDRYMGAMIRSRIKLIEASETPSKIFQLFEKQRIRQNRITQIRSSSGSVVKSQKEIEEVFYREYVKLFEPKQRSCPRLKYRLFENVPKVAKDIRERINKEITVAEIERAISQLPPNKSPGSDGIGAGFYKTFSDQVAPLLKDVFHDILKRNLMPPSMRPSITVMICKSSSAVDDMTVDSCRPISLLNNDYKILAKILSRRLDQGLQEVVDSHQT